MASRSSGTIPRRASFRRAVSLMCSLAMNMHSLECASACCSPPGDTKGWARTASNPFDMDARSERVARRFDVPMLVAALLVIPMLVIQESSLGEPWTTVADVLNWGTWLAFVVELVVMLAVVPDRWRWVRENPLDVIVTVITPPILPGPLAAARLLRLLRILRLLRLAPIMRRVFTIEGVRYAGLLAFLTLLVGGTAFANVEKEPDEWDGIWWAATTMTTVGYGEKLITTDAGRVIAIFVMVVGIGFGTLLIGAVAQRFVAPPVEAAERAAEAEVLAEIRTLAARLDRIEAAVGARPGDP